MASRAKRGKYCQKFRTEWLQEKEFKEWLIGPTNHHPEPTCLVCNKDVAPHHSGLVKHSQTQQHIKKKAKVTVNEPDKFHVYSSKGSRTLVDD